jgi:hypothetical protein
MTKRCGPLAWTALAAVSFAACGVPADTARVPGAVTATSRRAEPPTTTDLLAHERRAQAAYVAGDAASFAGLLNDRFVMLGPGGTRLDKAATLRRVAGTRCDVKGGGFEEPRLSTIDADTYVLSYRSTVDGTCTVEGHTSRAPSPVRAATVWVRRGDTWLAAFHGENPILTPHADPPPTAPAAPAVTPAAPRPSAGASTDARPAADPRTDALLAIESSVWDAWRQRSARELEELTASDLAFVDIFGNVTSGKAATITFWTEHQCDLQSVRVSDGTVTALSETVGILTFTGGVEGTCGGQRVPVIHGTSVYVRDGGAWKLAFTLNSLTH